MSKYKVSVIIPIYNVAEYLEECLDSMVKQSLDGIEVLMIDDGSTDISGTIAKRYADRYDNFFYYLKENGGLGNARNYGIQYVHGEYIIFLDSDDIVPDYAYEAMYQKAIETGNDMVVGDVQRFNSKKVYNSGLHRKAFRDAYDKTSILETPQLIYDTTSWNKLIKFSFWKQHNFKFPEKILYEDIPVTMPLHFYANGVSVINEIVYLWRTRDGANKSITQNRTELKNFTDRVKIMKMVDAFYEGHVHDEYALYMKDYKWMEVDLKLYIQEMIDADDEFIDYAMQTIREYKKKFRIDAFQNLPAIDRMKYYLIEKKDKTRLLQLLRYEKESYRLLKIGVKKTGDTTLYYGKFPFHDFPEEYYDMTKELNLYPEKRELQSVQWEHQKLTLSGYAFIPKLTCSSKKSQKLTARLLNIKTQEYVELPISKCKAKGVRGKHGIKIDRKHRKFAYFDYKWSGFELAIDFSNTNILRIANGLLKIEIHYERAGIDKTFYLGGPISGDAVRPKFLNIKDKNITPYYNLGYDLCFECTKVNAMASRILCTDSEFSMHLSMDEQTDIVYKTEKDGAILCDIEYQEHHANKAKNEAVLTIDKQHMLHGGMFLLKDGLVTTNDLAFSKYVAAEQGLIKIYCDTYGHICIDNKPFGTVLTSLNKEMNSLVIKTSAKLHKTINHIYLFAKGETSKIVSKEIEADFTFSNDEYTSTFFLRFDDVQFVSDLIADKWNIYVRYESDTESFVQNVYGDTSAKISKFFVNDYLYATNVDKTDYLMLEVSRKWKSYECNKLRRKAIEIFLYPLLRLLPLRKKTVVFEGWWGQKYHCNPKALYEYLDREHPDYTCIWSMVDERTRINGNGHKVRRKSLAYHYYMATAKYFVNNVNFMDSFKKRNKQIEVQTMHGTPLKTLGLDVPGELPTEEDRRRFLRKCNRWDYLVVQSKKAEDITSSCYAFKKHFLQTGYPRNDILFEKNNAIEIAKIKKSLHIPIHKKVIMYAPTWRVRNQFNINIDIEKLKKNIGEEYVVLLRIHPFSVKGLDESLLGDFIYNASNYPNVEELYLIADIVITDYSSVMFDYAILNRPMLFYTYDLEDYRDTLRGFNFDFVSEAPGPLLKNSDDLIHAIVNIDEVAKEYDSSLQQFRKKFCEYEHGNASKQIFDIVMKK